MIVPITSTCWPTCPSSAEPSSTYELLLPLVPAAPLTPELPLVIPELDPALPPLLIEALLSM